MADIRLPQRAEHGIANRVHQGIGIGMALQTLGMGDFHPAQYEFPSLDQGMHIIADANMNHARYPSTPPRPSQGIYRPGSPASKIGAGRVACGAHG